MDDAYMVDIEYFKKNQRSIYYKVIYGCDPCICFIQVCRLFLDDRANTPFYEVYLLIKRHPYGVFSEGVNFRISYIWMALYVKDIDLVDQCPSFAHILLHLFSLL